MRKLTALGALLLVGFLGVAAAAPRGDEGLPVPAFTSISAADAAISRGGGEGGSEGGGGSQVLKRFFSWLQSEISAGFFVLVAIGLAIPIFQRNAGAAVALLVAAFVIGAFLLVPDQVESFFRSLYNLVL